MVGSYLSKTCILVGFVVITACSACISKQAVVVVESTDYFKKLSPEQVEKEMVHVRNSIGKGGAAQEEAELHLNLAILLLDPANSAPDYAGARKALNKYQELIPENDQEGFVAHISRLLDEIKQSQNSSNKVRRENKGLKQKNKALNLKNSELIKHNKELEKKISKLKYLDIRLERKRYQTE